MNSLPGPGLPVNRALVAALHEKSAVFPAIIRPNKNKKIDQKALHEAIEKDKGIIAQRQYAEILKKKIKDTETAAPSDKVAKLTAPYRRELKSAEDYIRRRTKELEDRLAEKFQRNLQSDGTSSNVKKWERYQYLKVLERRLAPEVKELKERAASLHRGDPVAPSLQQELAMYDKLIERTRNRIELLNVELEVPPRVTWPGGQVTIHTPYDRMKIATTAAAAVGIVLLVLAWMRFRNRSSAPSLLNTPS
jgi:hypothetical protein